MIFDDDTDHDARQAERRRKAREDRRRAALSADPGRAHSGRGVKPEQPEEAALWREYRSVLHEFGLK